MADPDPGLFEELKRRRVLRVAGMYLVAALAMVEAADIVLPRLGLPDWTVTLVVALVILGFVPAVALAWAFDLTPDGLRRAPPRDAPSPGAPRPAGPRKLPGRSVAVIIAAVALVALGAWNLLAVRGGPALDADRLALMPFAISSPDADLAYLAEGMMDLLATKLGGEAGFDVHAPGAVLTRIHDDGLDPGALSPEDAAAVARRLGAGRTVTGQVVGRRERLTITVRLMDADGREITHATRTVPEDSVDAAADYLAGRLLAEDRGVAPDRIPAFDGVPLAALRPYLDGMALYRRARFEEAARELDRAVRADSTFAIAALRQYMAESWSEASAAERQRTLDAAWRYRERLPPVDRVVLQAEVGPRHPAYTPRAEHLQAVEEALASTPDSPELWHIYGDRLFHDGAMLGIDDWAERAVRAFQRARELGPELPDSDIHLRDMAAWMRDTTLLRQVGSEILARDSVGHKADETVWIMAMLLDDPALEARERRRRDSLAVGTVNSIRALSAAARIGVEEAMDAAERLERRAVTRSDKIEAMTTQTWIGMNAGWRALVDAQMDRQARLREQPPRMSGDEEEILQLYLWAGLAWDGDMERAANAARQLEEIVRGDVAAYAADRPVQPHYLGALIIWNALHGELGRARELYAHLERQAVERDDSWGVASAALAPPLDALIAYHAGDPDARDLAVRADDFLRTGPYWNGRIVQAGNWVVARLHIEQGDDVRALAAYKRIEDAAQPNILPEVLREQGRLAELTGDTAWAIRCYRGYLDLRPGPDPSVRHHDDRVRAALVRLTRERGA